MNIYKVTKGGRFDTNLASGGVKSLPPHHRQILESQVLAGDAEIIEYTLPEGTNEAIERAWRDSELAIADIELNKVQDGRGIGLVSDWRDYRNELRNWPEHAGFPNSSYRPTFKNTDD